MRLRILRSAATLLLAFSAGQLFAQEPPCATNYTSDGKSSTTFVLTTLTPQATVERLPSLLGKAGVVMEWSVPDKGLIQADGLDVHTEKSGDATRVTFHSPANADKKTLCSYASLVGGVPVKKKAVAQDAALIARMKDDLLKKHQIMQPVVGGGLNHATFSSMNDFLEFAVTDIKTSSASKEYEVSMLVPRSAGSIASEDLDDSSLILRGIQPDKRTKPVRIEARLVYVTDGATTQLSDATIISIASTK
ncbi:MAG TPA: hypothetical protein VHX14_23905 [Thermoanaerobaculia bacterium]|jgi:hypothetical protein|nr:hypothetical protein [Thermoanaerobaculia bacterium]